MAQNTNRPLKAFVRFDGTGRIVPSSLILRRKKPKVGKWVEIPAYECCNYTTTTTTTTAACIETEWEYTITAEDVENATGNTGEVIIVNVPNPLEVTAYDEFGGFYVSNCPSGYSGGGFAFNSGQIGTYTLCSVNEPYIWYYHNNAAVFITVTDTLTPC
jgi:hypothetical protein